MHIILDFYWKVKGVKGVKQIPPNPTKISEIIELFCRDNFFQMCEETNLYYYQNQQKYDKDSKRLKWSDVMVVDMIFFFFLQLFL